MATVEDTRAAGRTRPRPVWRRGRASGTAAAAVVLFLLPFYLLLRNALSSETDITSSSWTFFPKVLHWSNISGLFNDGTVPFARSLANSAVIAVLQTGGR